MKKRLYLNAPAKRSFVSSIARALRSMPKTRLLSATSGPYARAV